MEPDPTGGEGQDEQRCNKDQKSKAFQAKQDEVCGTEFKRSCDTGAPPGYSYRRKQRSIYTEGHEGSQEIDRGHGRAKSSLPRYQCRGVGNGSGSSPVVRAALELGWSPQGVHARRGTDGRGEDCPRNTRGQLFLIGLVSFCSNSLRFLLWTQPRLLVQEEP